MIDFNNDFPTTISKDLFWLCLGDYIGSGIGRDVYVFSLDETKVIKIETTANSFQNILEWKIWEDIKETNKKKYFAECFYISPNGIYLIQERTEKPLKKDYPKLIPKFFTDTKYDNYGIVYRKNKKYFVAHDYGMIPNNRGLDIKKIKADWWK